MNYQSNVKDEGCVEVMIENVRIAQSGQSFSGVFVKILPDEAILTLHGDHRVLSALSKVFPRDMAIRPINLTDSHGDSIMLWGLLQAIVGATGAEVSASQIAKAMKGLSYRVSAMYPTMQTDRCEAVLHIFTDKRSGETMRSLLLKAFCSRFSH